MSITISIIIVIHSNDKYIFKCLASFQNVIRDFKNFDIVLVNNNIHETIDINECSNQLKILKEEQNHGFGSANNLGVKNSSGELLGFVNPDIELKTDLSNAIEYLDKDPRIGVLGIRLLNADGSWQRSYGNFPSLGRKFCEVFFLSKFFKNVKVLKGIHDYNEYKSPTEVDWVSGAFMIIRREAFEKVNGFDENFFLYLEDIDLCKRIKENGWKIVYYPFAEAVHHLGGESKLSKDFVIDHGDSPYIYFKKHCGLWSLPLLYTMILIESLFKSFVFLILSLVNKKYLRPLIMYRNILAYTLFKAPFIIVKQIDIF